MVTKWIPTCWNQMKRCRLRVNRCTYWLIQIRENNVASVALLDWERAWCMSNWFVMEIWWLLSVNLLSGKKSCSSFMNSWVRATTNGILGPGDEQSLSSGRHRTRPKSVGTRDAEPEPEPEPPEPTHFGRSRSRSRSRQKRCGAGSEKGYNCDKKK